MNNGLTLNSDMEVYVVIVYRVRNHLRPQRYKELKDGKSHATKTFVNLKYYC